jgi:hypothetical protein
MKACLSSHIMTKSITEYRNLTRQKKGGTNCNEKSQGNCKFIFPERLADGVKAENQRFQQK